MKKHTSKLIALVLALCLCLSLSVSAFAAEIDSSGGSGSTPVNLSSIEKVFLRFQPFPDHLSDNKQHQRTKQNSRRSEDADPHIYYNCDNNGIYAQLFP